MINLLLVFLALQGIALIVILYLVIVINSKI